MREPHHRRLSVAEVIVETQDARSFVLDVPDEHADRFRYRPGQFLTVRVPCPDGGYLARCYSLSSAPGDGRLTITVKRMPSGHGSAWLCDNVVVGTELDVLPPAGTFTPRSLDADLLLFAAGSGITPVISIIRSALTDGHGEIVLVYANRDADSIIFDADLRRLAVEHSDRLTVVHWLESIAGLPNAAALRDLAAPHADHEVYLCGPEAFMTEVDAALRQLTVPRGRVHVERFVSLPGDPFTVPDVLERALSGSRDIAGVRVTEPSPADAAPGVAKVELDGVTHTIPWPADVRLLDLLVDNDLAAPFSCRQGLCGACTCRVEEGEVAMVNNEVLEPEDLQDGYVLACQALRRSETVRISYT